MEVTIKYAHMPHDEHRTDENPTTQRASQQSAISSRLTVDGDWTGHAAEDGLRTVGWLNAKRDIK